MKAQISLLSHYGDKTPELDKIPDDENECIEDLFIFTGTRSRYDDYQRHHAEQRHGHVDPVEQRLPECLTIHVSRIVGSL